MATPTADEQIEFLRNLQLVLDEGSFVATYKYALLLALADLSVECGDDSGEPLTLSLDAIAEKFIQYYWPQARPLPRTTPPTPLYQNSGKQAAIVNRLSRAQRDQGHSLATLRSDVNTWKHLRSTVRDIVKNMPLWRLQTVGKKTICFLYPNVLKQNSITLLPGVACNLRTFHPMITHMVQGAWVAEIRKLSKNQDLLGQRFDLSAFLFGSERNNLGAYREVLLDIEGTRCFYCDKPIRQTVAVDHFIAWARYPIDLGHNFVLSHRGCNSDKSDHLASLEHLKHWLDRNRTLDGALIDAFSKKHLLHDRNASEQIARWAYSQAESRGSPLWVRKGEFSNAKRGGLSLLEGGRRAG